MTLSIKPPPDLVKSPVRRPLEYTIGQYHQRRWSEILPAGLATRDVATVVARSLLDRVEARLLDDEQATDDAMTELMSGLRSLKTSASPEAWENVVKECVDHPICELIHQDPFSARSFHKPRGYAGDAVLIDYIYSRSFDTSGQETPTPLGQRIFKYNCDTPACSAVRARRDLLGSILDQTSLLKDQPDILSVACGHLREAQISRAVPSGQTGRFVALDQDELSLAIVQKEVASPRVTTVCNSIRSLFRGEIAGEKFDLIYSTGLYDYLDERTALRLTARMFDMLNPGGRLLVANFLPGLWGTAFMEAFMGWKLIYRNTDQMLRLTSALPREDIAGRRVLTEKNENVVFLDLVHA
jgi:SAM-dependent methyltransferase